MSKVLGIIAEYNPFHNGHLYHIENSKKITNCDYTIAVMSGNFTQRGSTSLIDKWSKAEIALNNGIDLVIELPLLYSISSAENFAAGAVKILNSLGVVDFISFGVETPDIDLLSQIADILYHEPKDFKNILQQELFSGISYPKARENALLKYLNDDEKYFNILSSPNNILGIEYIKSLKKYKSTIQPVCIPRYKVGHNDIKTSDNITSSTSIRNIINSIIYNISENDKKNIVFQYAQSDIRNIDDNKFNYNNFDILKEFIPSSSYSILMNNITSGHIISDLNVFGRELLYNLRKMPIEEISKLPDVSEGLEFSIKKTAYSSSNILEFLKNIKTKRYTSTRIQRILLYSLLGITKDDMEISKNINPYIRILGFNEKGRNLVSKISKNRDSSVPLITSVKKFIDINNDKYLELMLNKDILATNIYTLGYKSDSFGNLDFTHKLVGKRWER